MFSIWYEIMQNVRLDHTHQIGDPEMKYARTRAKILNSQGIMLEKMYLLLRKYWQEKT